MRLLIVPFTLSALIAGCNSDEDPKPFNSAPMVAIVSHGTGDTVVEGVPETLRGQVGDPDHESEDLSVSWYLDGTVICDESTPDETGSVSCTITFGPDNAEVALEVRDAEDAGANASVELDVQPSDAPIAEITSPTSEGVYYSNQPITFEGTVFDTEDAADQLTVTWSSSLDGTLADELNTPDADGGLFGTVTLAEGEHLITLTVIDTTRKEGTASTVVSVGPPDIP